MRHIFAKTAFAGSYHVMITGAPSSYARIWAQKNNIPFVPTMMIYAGTTSNVQVYAGTTNRVIYVDLIIVPNEKKKENRQWRLTSEIKAEKYDQFIASHNFSRAPPENA